MATWKWMKCAVGELNLGVLAFGQSFRWKKIENGGEIVWQGVMANRVWQLKRNDDQIGWRILGRFSRCGSKEEDENVLRDYFQLDTVPSLGDMYTNWSSIDPHFASIADRISGIRVLRQDPVECLFSFICSTNNNIKRITGMVNTLCRLYGEEIKVDIETEISIDQIAVAVEKSRKRRKIDRSIGDESISNQSIASSTKEQLIFYDFPTVTSLGQSDIESILRTNGFGYRAQYIAATSKILLTEFKTETAIIEKLANLRLQNRQETVKFLLKLQGVGPKVADCVALMSMDTPDSVPVDTHVRRITSERYLPTIKKTGSLTGRMYEEIGQFYRSLFGSYAGWAHSVLFSAEVSRS